MNRFFYTAQFILYITGLFFPLSTSGCRYTVREIGFSDIGSMPYLINIFRNYEMHEDDISTIINLSLALLYESNVNLEIVNIDEEKDSITRYLLDKHNIHSFPSALFVTPYGESMICSLNYQGRSFNESVWLLLESLVSSSIRKKIVDQLLRSYCIVLVIEGGNASKNRDAINAANEAVREITGTMSQMPKVVNSFPVILVIPQEKIHDERFFLMSLGINEDDLIDPNAAIIYGRGRIMGPVLQGAQITQRNLFNLLTVVGADCECGLDHSWILGRMIPLRWESQVQSELAKFLGFDVENPLVKAEMSQILSIKPVFENPLNPLENNILGYSEEELTFEEESKNVSKVSAYDIQKSFPQRRSLKHNPVSNTIMMGFGGVLLIVSVIGVIFFINLKRKKNS